jgi:protease II
MCRTVYGAYGTSREPRFSLEILSLLDRGYLFAIAHVRGGSEMGNFFIVHELLTTQRQVLVRRWKAVE